MHLETTDIRRPADGSTNLFNYNVTQRIGIQHRVLAIHSGYCYRHSALAEPRGLPYPSPRESYTNQTVPILQYTHSWSELRAKLCEASSLAAATLPSGPIFREVDPTTQIISGDHIPLNNEIGVDQAISPTSAAMSKYFIWAELPLTAIARTPVDTRVEFDRALCSTKEVDHTQNRLLRWPSVTKISSQTAYSSLVSCSQFDLEVFSLFERSHDDNGDKGELPRERPSA